jgi:hypothetical protein
MMSIESCVGTFGLTCSLFRSIHRGWTRLRCGLECSHGGHCSKAHSHQCVSGRIDHGATSGNRLMSISILGHKGKTGCGSREFRRFGPGIGTGSELPGRNGRSSRNRGGDMLPVPIPAITNWILTPQPLDRRNKLPGCGQLPWNDVTLPGF